MITSTRDIRRIPTVSIEGIEFPNCINSLCNACCFVDFSNSCQNPKNPKTLEEDYKENLRDRPEETQRTLAILKERRKSGQINGTNFKKYVDLYGPEFVEKPVKGIMLCGTDLGEEGGRALLKFINFLPKGCLKSINIIGSNVPEGLEEEIWGALEGHPVHQDHINCGFNRSDGRLYR